MRISKTRDEHTMQAEVRVKFYDKNFAEALGYEEEQSLFLTKHKNRDLFSLGNGDERLRSRSGVFEVKFSIKCDKIELTFIKYEKRLRTDMSVHSVMSHLFTQSLLIESKNSDYDSSDTDRVIWEFAATIALAAIKAIDEDEDKNEA